jgi:hypothetical protein
LNDHSLGKGYTKQLIALEDRFGSSSDFCCWLFADSGEMIIAALGSDAPSFFAIPNVRTITSPTLVTNMDAFMDVYCAQLFAGPNPELSVRKLLAASSC